MKKIVILIITIVVYVLLINSISSFSFASQQQINSQEDDVSGLKVGVGDAVSVSVKKSRFYGTIYQEDSQQDIKLFWFIPLPLKRGNFNYLFVHFPFLVFMVIILLKGGKNEDNIFNNSNSVDGMYNSGISSNESQLTN